ncbi:MAG: type I-G CRISPR-associated RAMP protein Csb1/Cas7g [Ancrocorticia sp.]|uniref:type I-G CRISPR-associated RAMP protein Csb1/Cas7g n=1 Tax=Ancrocorticia sp. TaxID=2593684 RepID=UPI003F8EC75B
MTRKLTWQDLVDACSPGGASVLVETTELAPAAGTQASVAPSRFVKGSNPTFDFQTRFIEGEPQKVVTIDSKQSMLNRVESSLSQAVDDPDPVVRLMPRIEVTYPNNTYKDIDLPHRAFDGHIRAGRIAGKPTTSDETYRAIRNSNPRDFSPILSHSPAVLAFGGWDSTRKSNQVRLRSALVGEIIGTLADQEADPNSNIGMRGGARVDPVGMSIALPKKKMEQLAANQEQELSSNNLQAIAKDIKKAGEGKASASRLGLGGVPPTLDTIGGVSCRQISRSWVLSFSTLRQMRFGSTPEGDAVCRALLAALALAGLARADRELYLRANCDLVETSVPKVLLDQRYGQSEEIDPLEVADMDALLQHAIEEASRIAGIEWTGQVLEVDGDESIYAAATDDSEDE